MAACSLADQVVIYCSGGDCTDSSLVAHLLRDAGVPVARLAVFVGGPDAEALARANGDTVAYRDGERPTAANGYQVHGPWTDA